VRLTQSGAEKAINAKGAADESEAPFAFAASVQE
jgi:hypothetical protein